MHEIVASGAVRLDGTKDADGDGILCNFKGTDAIRKLTIDLKGRAGSVPYKEDLAVQIVIERAQMTIDDVAEDGGIF